MEKILNALVALVGSVGLVLVLLLDILRIGL